MFRREFIGRAVAILLAPRLLFGQQPAKPAPPPPAPTPWELGLNPLTPHPHTEVADGIVDEEEHFFSPAQMASLVRLCDVLLPTMGDKPGALEAGTPLFLDFLIGSSAVARQKVYAGGLDWLNGEAQKKYKKPFAKVGDDEADALLRPWLRTWMSDHPPTEMHADFINIAHDEIRTATFNSKAFSGVAAPTRRRSDGMAMYWSPIEPDLRVTSPGTTKAVPPHVQAAPKAAHSMPAYQR